MYFVIQKYSFLCLIFYYKMVLVFLKESLCHINWMKFGSVPCLQYLFNKVALTIGLVKMTGLVLGGVCGSETYIYCTITLALFSWELDSLEGCSENFTLCTGKVSQCQSMSIPLLVTVPYKHFIITHQCSICILSISQATKPLNLTWFNQIQFIFQMGIFVKYVWERSYSSPFYRKRRLNHRDELSKFQLRNSISEIFSTKILGMRVK